MASHGSSARASPDLGKISVLRFKARLLPSITSLSFTLLESITSFLIFMEASERYPFSPALLGISQLLVFVSLILPPSISTSTRKWLFLPVLLILAHLTFRSTTGDVLTDVIVGPVLTNQCGQALDFILLCDPRVSFRRKAKGKVDGGPGDTFASRLKWATHLFFSPRGIGWTHEPPAHVLPRRISGTRTQFVMAKVVEALQCLLVETVAYIINSMNPALTTTSTSIRDYPWYLQVPAVAGMAAAAYARINIGHAMLSALAVGLGVSQPEDWPNLFGSLREMWCIGRFWSRTWHHLLRRTLTSAAYTLFPPTPSPTSIYAFAQLTSVFFASAIIHVSGDYMVKGQLQPGAFVFFMLQPFGILFERVVFRALGVRSGESPPKGVKFLGYLWTITWFTLTAPIMLDTMVHAGVFVHRSGNANLGAGVVDWWLERSGSGR